MNETKIKNYEYMLVFKKKKKKKKRRKRLMNTLMNNFQSFPL